MIFREVIHIKPFWCNYHTWLRYLATVPVTYGADIDVPDIISVEFLDPMYDDNILYPGAKMSTHWPKLEKSAITCACTNLNSM